jgi:small GTP-binding protein
MGDVVEYRKKILLIGDAAVGKTSLIRRMVVDIFDDKYITTIGTKITVKDMQISVEDELIYLKFQIWDILGQKGYTKLYHASFKGAHGVLFVADLTRKETLDSLRNYWIPQVSEVIGTMPFIILGNKCDLVTQAQFGLEELRDFAKTYNVPFYLTSAKNGDNVNDAFNTLGKRMFQSKGPRPKPKDNRILEVVHGGNALIIDKIIDDFSKSYGGIEEAMPVIRRQFELSNLDLNNPRREALVSVVERLADVEAGFQNIEVVKSNLRKRLRWIKET